MLEKNITEPNKSGKLEVELIKDRLEEKHKIARERLSNEDEMQALTEEEVRLRQEKLAEKGDRAREKSIAEFDAIAFDDEPEDPAEIEKGRQSAAAELVEFDAMASGKNRVGRKAERQPKTELFEGEKKEAIEFLKNDILPLYAAEKEKGTLKGGAQETEVFLREHFVETAKFAMLFDGEIEKINLAWDWAAENLPKIMEESEERPEEKPEEKMQEEEIFDMEADERIKKLGQEVQYRRAIYLRKKYRMNKASSKMSRFFKSIKNLKFSKVEEELAVYKDDYRDAVSNYSDAIVDMEGVDDKEEQEIMLKYFGVSEALNLKDEELKIKVEKDPKLLQLTTKYFGGALKGGLKGYKKGTTFLARKATELVGRKTDSKILKFTGGLGGGMAFAVGFSNIAKTTGAPYWITKSILLAASTAVMTLENKEAMDKDLEEKEIRDLEARKTKALEEMDSSVQGELAEAMKKVFSGEANKSLDYQEDKKALNQKMWLKAFGKAAGKNLLFYSAGFLSAELARGASELTKGFVGFLAELKNGVGADAPAFENSPPEVGASRVADVSEAAKVESDPHADEPASKDQTATEEASAKEKTGHAVGSMIADSSRAADEIFAENNQQTDSAEMPKEDPFDNRAFLESQGMNIVDLEMRTGGVKDNMKEFLMAHYNELTEGKMGWNPEKYGSIAEWAEKRAIGIVGEFAANYEHDLDRVPQGSRFSIDISNPADITIREFHSKH